jgi:tetratricopeptide (TPR) repeat protein
MKKFLIKSLLFTLCIIYSHEAIAQPNYIDSLRKVLSTEKEDTNKVNTLDYLSRLYWRAGDYDNAMQTATAVLSLATKIDFKVGIADGYKYIGLAYNIKKDKFNESEYFNKALTLYKETGNKQQIIYGYDLISQAYQREEDFAKELESEYAAQK